MQKSEAHAFAPALAGAGALAAELGISSEALLMGITVLVAGASGYMMAQDGWTNMSDQSVSGALGRLLDPNADLGDMTDADNYGDVWDSWSPDGRSWDDLTTDEKSKYGTPANWVANRWEDVFLATELTEAGNGGNQPTSDGGGPWQQVRNALILIGTGAAAVGLSEAAGALGALCGDGIHELLFGNDQYMNKSNTPMLWLPYQQNVAVDGVTFPFSVYGISYDRLSYAHFTPTNWGYYIPTVTGVIHVFCNGYNGSSYNLANYTIIVDGSNSYLRSGDRPVSAYYAPQYNTWSTNSNMSGTAGNLGFTTGMQLNQNYEGKYTFVSGGVEKASLENGSWTGDYAIDSVEYGQLPQTPPEIDTNIYSQPDLETGYQTIEEDTDDASKKNALALPTFLGQPQFTADPDYWTFVKQMPESEVSPLPDTEQVDPENPPVPDDPNPDTPVDPNNPWGDSFDQKVEQLLAQPFDNLFPFCLIGDARLLFSKIRGGDSTLSAQAEEDFSTISFDLSTFGEIFPRFDIDLENLVALGHMVRGPLTAAYLWALLIGTFRFFLVRGGE